MSIMSSSSTQSDSISSAVQSPLDCIAAEPSNTVTDRLNSLLASSGPDYVLKLCPKTRYYIQAPLKFTRPGQEISTIGYPEDESRATLVVAGPVQNGTGHTVAVEGQCRDCDGVKLRNIMIEGSRFDMPLVKGGANIEMGGSNSGQVIEYVKSYNPRGWSCLHIMEGDFTCKNTTVQNNEIGPCGKDTFQQWADGISLSCEKSIVRNNVIRGATDGGIVIFGSPGSWIYNNTISVGNQTLLGGINMVDWAPYRGNYRGTVVQNNTIIGSFADQGEKESQPKGVNKDNVFIKMGIAIGPRCWFGDRLGSNRSESGIVLGNKLTGALGYAIAVTSAFNFTVQDNTLFGNTSFIGVRGPKCTSYNKTPPPTPFIIDYNLTSHCNIQSDFQIVSDGDSLVCVVPEKGNYWPFQTNQRYFPALATDALKSDIDEAVTGIAALTGVIFVILGCWILANRFAKRIDTRNSRSTYRLISDPASSPY